MRNIYIIQRYTRTENFTSNHPLAWCFETEQAAADFLRQRNYTYNRQSNEWANGRSYAFIHQILPYPAKENTLRPHTAFSDRYSLHDFKEDIQCGNLTSDDGTGTLIIQNFRDMARYDTGLDAEAFIDAIPEGTVDLNPFVVNYVRSNVQPPEDFIFADVEVDWRGK